MTTVSFTPALRRFLPAPCAEVVAGTVGQALDTVFLSNPRLRGYVLDDQGAVRTHVTVFLNGWPIRDRASLADPVGPLDQIHVIQALSGG